MTSEKEDDWNTIKEMLDADGRTDCALSVTARVDEIIRDLNGARPRLAEYQRVQTEIIKALPPNCDERPISELPVIVAGVVESLEKVQKERDLWRAAHDRVVVQNGAVEADWRITARDREERDALSQRCADEVVNAGRGWNQYEHMTRARDEALRERDEVWQDRKMLSNQVGKALDILGTHDYDIVKAAELAVRQRDEAQQSAEQYRQAAERDRASVTRAWLWVPDDIANDPPSTLASAVSALVTRLNDAESTVTELERQRSEAVRERDEALRVAETRSSELADAWDRAQTRVPAHVLDGTLAGVVEWLAAELRVSNDYGKYIDRLWDRWGEGEDWTLDDLSDAIEAMADHRDEAIRDRDEARQEAENLRLGRPMSSADWPDPVAAILNQLRDQGHRVQRAADTPADAMRALREHCDEWLIALDEAQDALPDTAAGDTLAERIESLVRGADERIEELTRQRDEASRERDEAVRRVDERDTRSIGAAWEQVPDDITAETLADAMRQVREQRDDFTADYRAAVERCDNLQDQCMTLREQRDEARQEVENLRHSYPISDTVGTITAEEALRSVGAYSQGCESRKMTIGYIDGLINGLRAGLGGE